MSKFITPVAMKVTAEQYEQDLKQPLEELGYKWCSYNYKNPDCGLDSDNFPYLATRYLNDDDFRDILHYKSMSSESEVGDPLEIDYYNPQLFLALAAMTEGSEPIVGEYIYWLGDNATEVPIRVIGRCPHYDDSYVLDKEGYTSCSVSFIRKATKEELVDHFAPKEEKMEGFAITANQAQSIIDVAPIRWRRTLAELWGTKIALGETVEVEKDRLDAMKEVFTSDSQVEVLDAVFEVKPKVGQVWMNKISGDHHLITQEIMHSSYRLIHLPSGKNINGSHSSIEHCFGLGGRKNFTYIGMAKDVLTINDKK